MNATLLCPGPSLSKYSGERADIVVGVNRAATAHVCDVWAATDRPLIQQVAPMVLGTPTLFTIAATRDSLDRRDQWWRGLVVTHCGIAGGVVTNAKHPWTRYTSTAALAYLAWIGAKDVHVWGCDWAGSADWDGVVAGSGRTLERWRAEREIWDGVIEANGLTVTRHK